MKQIFLLLLLLPYLSYSQMVDDSLSTIDSESFPPPPPPPPPLSPEMSFVEDYFSLLQIISDCNNYQSTTKKRLFVLDEKGIIDSMDLYPIEKGPILKELIDFDNDSLNQYYYYNVLGIKDLYYPKVFDNDGRIKEVVKFGYDSLVNEKIFFVYNKNGRLQNMKKYEFLNSPPDSSLTESTDFQYRKSKLYYKKNLTKHSYPKNTDITETYYNRKGKIVSQEGKTYNSSNELIFHLGTVYKFNRNQQLTCLKSIGEYNEEILITYDKKKIITYTMLKGKKKFHQAFMIK
jgi:hypothetical protein